MALKSYGLEIPLFFTALDDSHGAISASTTLVIFEPSARIEWQPHNLNIVVPWQEPHIIARFLRSIGYIQQGNSRIPFRWYHLVCRHMQFCKSGCPDIFISEGYDKTALPIILGTSTTAVMNAITSTTYYSFYPAMTRRREVVPNWTGAMSGDAQKYSARGYKLFNYAPREGPYMCGQGCALEARRVRGRRGIGVITWTTRHAESYKFDQDEIVWQLGEECRYRHCQNRETVGFSGQR